ncbi:MAG: PQQ-binding-like beta-propeller repeat protein [Pseudomonadota bacterium]
MTRRFGMVAGAVVAGLLAGCGQQEDLLPGQREAVRPVEVTANIAVPFTPPRQVATPDWTHRGGDADKFVPHPALGNRLTEVWSVDIGEGNGRRHRITADPIVSGGRIYTIDSRARITATTTAGQVAWQADLTPATDKADDASGGGLAAAGGRIFATSGFGRLAALDAATGEVLWMQRLGASITTAPTVFGNTVYAVSRDSRVWALNAETGRISWELPGAPSASSVLGAAAPAVTQRIAVFPLPSGELVATLRQSGLRIWAAPIQGGRDGKVYSRINDITGDPVVSGGRIYAGNATGRTVALSANSGERLWTAREGALGPVQVAGGSVFLVSDQNELVRLDANTGTRIWGVDLPLFTATRERRLRDIYPHFGPVLAGGQLYIASGDELLRAFNPETGALTATYPLRGGGAALPAVANGTLYVVSGDGRLHAFR